MTLAVWTLIGVLATGICALTLKVENNPLFYFFQEKVKLEQSLHTAELSMKELNDTLHNNTNQIEKVKGTMRL